MNAPAQLRPVSHPQAVKLEALIRTAMAAREAAARGDLFASYAGKSLVLAAHDLFECDGLYAISLDVAHEIGDDPDASPVERAWRRAQASRSPADFADYLAKAGKL